MGIRWRSNNGVAQPVMGKRNTARGWRVVGGKRIFFKSKMEANYARYLQFLVDHHEIQSWKYEAKEFWFEKVLRGLRSYKPDFEVVTKSGLVEYHEVKGWMDNPSRVKLDRMKKYYPEVSVRLIDDKWYRKNKKQLKSLIKDWE